MQSFKKKTTEVEAMAEPFYFFTRLNLVELLGRKAKNIGELHQGIQAAPGASIYYHTHRFLQQHHFLSPEPPNDFAFWVEHSLGQDELAERLASVDTIKFRRIGDLKERFVKILESYLGGAAACVTDSPPGEEFHFMSCRTFILPTAHIAHDLPEFRRGLEEVSIDSIYFHMFEARVRLEKGDNDFSNWLAELGEKELARQISRLDPYTITLEGLRKKLVSLVGKHVQT
jgi:hypothetical protein